MQSVNAYIQLISSISIIEERFVVTFMFDDTVYSILLVPDGVTKALKSTDIYANSVLFCYIITYFYAVSRIFAPYHF